MRDSELNRDRLRQIVEDPNWKEAVARVREDLFNDWCEVAKDAMERDQIFHTQKALDLLVAKLVTMAHDPTSL